MKNKNLFIFILAFLINYIISSILYLFILARIVSKNWKTSNDTLISILSIIAFVFACILIIKKMMKANMSSIPINFTFSLTTLLFYFPIINSSYFCNEFTYNKINSCFGGIYPFGYGVISMFIEHRYEDFCTKSYQINYDFMFEFFENIWLRLHIISIILAIISIYMLKQYLRRKIYYKMKKNN